MPRVAIADADDTTATRVVRPGLRETAQTVFGRIAVGHETPVRGDRSDMQTIGHIRRAQLFARRGIDELRHALVDRRDPSPLRVDQTIDKARLPVREVDGQQPIGGLDARDTERG